MQALDDERKQRAEVAAYFRQFDEAENIYINMGRTDLAINLHMRLGDWERVKQLIEVRPCKRTDSRSTPDSRLCLDRFRYKEVYAQGFVYVYRNPCYTGTLAIPDP